MQYDQAKADVIKLSGSSKDWLLYSGLAGTLEDLDSKALQKSNLVVTKA